MNRENVIRLAREAGPLVSTPFDVWCDRFAALVAAAEREACAKICDECMSDSVRRLTMANKQLTKMCDLYLAEKQQADTEMTSLRTLIHKARELLDREMPYLNSNRKWEAFCELVVEIDAALAGEEAGEMSCRHGNWSGCEVCEEIEKAEMDMRLEIESLRKELKNALKKYDTLIGEDGYKRQI